ncbi:MAG: D-alanyl-lipoteichoic acid biosynthesis protein DltD [Streptococcaceae bacterium]|jgi:D-alanine transfer protein|nr:D-alanyl-lipoteichoic acid biosynthesis protein DltD [Streptococcaceae bacterium]
MRKTSVFKAFGPLFCAFILVAILLFSPLNKTHRYTEKETDKFANLPQSIEVFTSDNIKHQALENKKYLPIMGSSELFKFDSFHPSVLAAKYQRDYAPFLIGFNGAHSLAHYFYMDGLKNELNHRKLIFIFSPQWFKTKKSKQGEISLHGGMVSSAFKRYVTTKDLYHYIKSADPSDITTKFMAKRLLKFSLIKGDFLLRKNLTLLAHGKKLDMSLKAINSLQYNFLEAEDALFQKLFLPVSFVNIKDLEKKLPNKYDQKKLDHLAYKLGKKQSKSNPYGINDFFFKYEVGKGFKKMKNAQIKTNFLHGMEYNDLQLLLNLFAKNHNDVLFVIPPVNGKWMKYTGLRQSMMKKFSKKIKYQLNSQGFNNVVDFVGCNNEPYFMYDTIHIGKRGWLALDQKITKFMKKANAPENYQINNQEFLSKGWLEVDNH